MRSKSIVFMPFKNFLAAKLLIGSFCHGYGRCYLSSSAHNYVLGVRHRPKQPTLERWPVSWLRNNMLCALAMHGTLGVERVLAPFEKISTRLNDRLDFVSTNWEFPCSASTVLGRLSCLIKCMISCYRVGLSKGRGSNSHHRKKLVAKSAPPMSPYS